MALIDVVKKIVPWGTPMREAAGVTIDDDEDNWTRLTDDTKRNLGGPTHQRMQEMALYLWKTNTVAKAMTELPIAYLLADGVTVSVVDEEAQEWINQFWNDPINQMDIKLEKKVRELSIYGDQCWPVFVNEFNGHTRLGYIDPGQIATVVTDPDNVEQAIGIVTKKNAKGIARRYRVIVNGPEKIFSDRTQEIRKSFEDGDCFYYSVNALSNSDRGHSDLLSQIDWLDAYDQALFGEMERWDFLRSFVWDVEITGANKEEIEERAKKMGPPTPGSVRVHNEQEKWNAVTPDLNSDDSAESARLLRNHILGGNTIPEHWFGGGGDVNRSTAEGMGEPTVKIFKLRQNALKYILVDVMTFVIRQKVIAYSGDLADEILADPIYKPTVIFPELTSKDTSKYATAFMQVINAAAVALERELLSIESAISIVTMIASQLGVDLDPKEELEKVRNDISKREEADNFTSNEKLDDVA